MIDSPVVATVTARRTAGLPLTDGCDLPLRVPTAAPTTPVGRMRNGERRAARGPVQPRA